MKSMKTILVTVALMGTMLATNAQSTTVVRVYPKHGTVVKTIANPSVIVHKKTNYYYADGVWYKTQGKRYVVTAVPRGVKIKTLPRGSKVVYRNGKRFYQYRGVWYKKRGRNYIVVNV
ncbi:DUF6515 family protein [Allomuricauda sp. F6463D]|uniref:DUF6515 family protein n=1 Tax=Allomuricauda sp. F6463D TaxID=2926409 RepID=UPI001FF4FC0F|nr:DUF6515 family protein [Muricauda sp. F6463D]MCK0159911.1 DUF6515 family protein [Muricauda sp. F6463D]